MVGPENPEIENSEPVAEIFVSVSFFTPRLATITGWLAFEPTPTLPKSIALGVRWSPSFEAADGFPAKPTQPEVASIPKNASNTTSTFAAPAPRFAITRKLGVASPWFGVRTLFMSECIVGERTWGRLLARGTRGGQGVVPPAKQLFHVQPMIDSLYRCRFCLGCPMSYVSGSTCGSWNRRRSLSGISAFHVARVNSRDDIVVSLAGLQAGVGKLS